MPVALDLMKLEDRSISLWQTVQSSRQSDAFQRKSEAFIRDAKFTPWSCFSFVLAWIVDRDVMRTLTPEMHEGRIHCKAIQPCRERGLSTKGVEFTEDLEEDLLR